MCIILCKSTRYDLTGYISLVIKLNILNHMMILDSADYSYNHLIIIIIIIINIIIIMLIIMIIIIIIITHAL